METLRLKAPSMIRTLALFALIFSATVPAALAVSYDIKQETPEVKQALQGRQARYSAIQNLKLSGQVGENNRGYLDVLQGGGNAAALVQAENSDRGVIYRAIVQQNGLPASAISQVESAFADVQRDRAKAGESVQLSNGQWTKK